MKTGSQALEAWADLIGRVYADTDFTPGGREVALVLAWVMYRDPRGAAAGRWERAKEILGQTGTVYRRWRLWEALAEDLPRYEPDWLTKETRTCEGPRMRPYRPREPRSGCLHEHHPHLGNCQFVCRAAPPAAAVTASAVCGSHATICITGYDPVTGWETRHWFCSRHKQRAHEVAAQLKAAAPDPPPPIPNRGGVLPRYFIANWEAQYRKAAENGSVSCRVGWGPSYYGVCRDDWPVPGAIAIPRRPRLAIIS